MSQQPQCRVCGKWVNYGPCACDDCLTIIEKQRDDLALYAEQSQTAEARRALGEERILKQEAIARAEAAEKERDIAVESLNNWIRVARNTTAQQEPSEEEVERVAAVIFNKVQVMSHRDYQAQDGYDGWRTVARAAIAAMREGRPCG